MSEFRMRSVVQGRARDPDPVRLPPVRVGAAAQPSSVIPGRPSAAEEDCAFSREEVEVHATYIRSLSTHGQNYVILADTSMVRGTMFSLCAQNYIPRGEGHH